MSSSRCAGPSGCGKSTLLHLAGGLEDPSAGRVLVDGRDYQHACRPRSDRRCAAATSATCSSASTWSPGSPRSRTSPFRSSSTASARRRARTQALDALHAVGLDQSLDRYPDDFSGGQQQRIAIARAIVGTRRLLLADEPTGSLDTATGDAVIELLAALPARAGHRGRARDPRAAVRGVGRSHRVDARRPHRRHRDRARRGAGVGGVPAGTR